MVLIITFNDLLASLGKVKYALFFIFIVYNKIRHAKAYLIREITFTVQISVFVLMYPNLHKNINCCKSNKTTKFNNSELIY